MNPTVVAAWIAAGISVLTLIGTVITQIIGFRSMKADTEQQIRATHENIADTLEQHRELTSPPCHRDGRTLFDKLLQWEV